MFSTFDYIRNYSVDARPKRIFKLKEAYPELIEESVPYMQGISHQTGVRQFVISCNFNSVEMVEAFTPHIQKAASALAGEGITLCYHNHHM